MSKQEQLKFASMALGCKTNQYEMDALNDEATAAGFQLVSADELADVYVLNTCTVTAEAGRKCRQMLRRFRKQNPEALIVCSGCHSELYDLGSLCDFSIGTVGRSELLAAIIARLAEKDNKHLAPTGRERLPAGRSPLWTEYEELAGTAYPEETRAYLKIQDGCDNRCSYCATTLARGPARSRQPEAILAEAEALLVANYRELVLTGTNLNSYGCDWQRNDPKAPGLIELLEDLNRIPKLIRMRLSSIDAAGIISDEFMERYAGLERACPHFHLSLQSGSDKILRAMRRRDTRGSFRKAVQTIRKHEPEAGISTDIIVGFPGETEEDFQHTVDFCEEMDFMRIHVFRFSQREDTLAYAMPDQVHGDIKRERAEIMHVLAEKLAHRAIDRSLGESREVLAERYDDLGRWHGYTEDYLPAIVLPDRTKPISRGDLLKVSLLERCDSFVIARVSD